MWLEIDKIEFPKDCCQTFSCTHTCLKTSRLQVVWSAPIVCFPPLSLDCSGAHHSHSAWFYVLPVINGRSTKFKLNSTHGDSLYSQRNTEIPTMDPDNANLIMLAWETALLLTSENKSFPHFYVIHFFRIVSYISNYT